MSGASLPLRLVPDCGSLIQEMAMALPPFLFAPGQELKRHAIAQLIETLPKEIVLFLMTEAGQATILADWIESLAVTCELHLVDGITSGEMRDTDIWTQDPFLAAEHDGASVLRHLVHTDHPGRHAYWLARYLQMTCDEPPVHLAGGNMLTGESFRLVGAQSLANTATIGDRPITPAEAFVRHAALDERPMHIFGFSLPGRARPACLAQQPHHLDLVVSLTGKTDATGRPILLVADPRKTVDPDGPRMEGWADQLDASVARLEADGFAVLRNRVPYVAGKAFAPNPMLRAYNNVILENAIRTNSGKTRPLIWLPHFGDLEPDLQPYDDENRQIWEGLGFETIPVYGWSAFIRTGGAIRCASKVLRRIAQPATSRVHGRYS